ncbi:MAG: ABC transporter permease, partial [Actinomycetota bacterium]
MKKLRPILLRLSQVCLVLIGATFLVSVLIRQLPGDVALLINPAASQAERVSLRQELGLDRNYFSAYWMWLSRMLQGDFGFFIFGGKVLPVLKTAIPPTLQLI